MYCKRFLPALLLLLASSPLPAADCVVLLHGLARTSASLDRVEQALLDNGYLVANIDYPSRTGTIRELAAPTVEAGLASCTLQNAERIDVVTHSLGGILLRVFLETGEIENLHRVVMLAPPNQGSEVVDVFRNVPGYRWLNGPAGLELGTDADSVPLNLGPVSFALGVIAGNQSINLILSQFLDNPDDGKVSVKNTRVEGMCGFIEMPATHAMMMRDQEVIAQVLSWLARGEFTGEGAENNLCETPP